METIRLQISSGKGPAECCLAVTKALKELSIEAIHHQLSTTIISETEGPEKGTLHSVLLEVKGNNAECFCQNWEGSILWISQSPYRKQHKRKNWYISIERLGHLPAIEWNEKEIQFQSLRSSGPGGQHVNKVETAIRAIHVPSGIQVTASEYRSQLQNKKSAVERLHQLLADSQQEKLKKDVQQQWSRHQDLQRGNPVRTYKGADFHLQKS